MSSCQQLWFSFVSVNLDKVIWGIEINSNTDQTTTRQKKSLLKALDIKHKYESVADVKSELLHGYFLMFSYQKCWTTFLEKEYQWLSLTVKIFYKNIVKYRKLLDHRHSIIVIRAHVVKVYNNYASTLIIYKVNRNFSFLHIIYFP